jgi:hypothetical protein
MSIQAGLKDRQRRVVKNMNIFKRLFNWVQSAPADFCYVTGEWGFKEKGSAKPAPSSNVFERANNRRSYAARPAPVVSVVAARVAALAAAPAPETHVAHDPVLADLFIPNPSAGAQEQNGYARSGR